jgi:hypothetical protein
MRRFRDGFVLSHPEGTALVSDYYRTAPAIVERIRRQRDAKDVFEKLLASTRRVVALVQAGENSTALALCANEFKTLKSKYLGR